MDASLTVEPWDIDDVLYRLVQYPVDIDLLRVRAILTQLFFQFFNLISALLFDIEVFLIVYGFGKQFVPCHRQPANPPYGVDWKGYEKDVKKDETGRFVALPSISDGQFLFTQHILHKLNNENGFAVVVHNGSTLFSSDAGSGESNIRKHFFDQHWVEAIIQMPTDEFFNTGIYNYLWVFNKNKPAERKDKVILINGSDFWEPLKKSKGKKRRQMNPENRNSIVDAFVHFEDCDYAKVFDKWHFYYNKQSIVLTNVDKNGKSIAMPTKVNKAGETVEEKSIKLTPTKLSYVSADGEQVEIDEFEISDFDQNSYPSLEEFFIAEIKEQINSIDYKESDVKIHTAKAVYLYDNEKETIVEQSDKSATELGNGKTLIKTAYKKTTKTKEACIQITVELAKDTVKDYEIIAYAPDKTENQKLIADFMEKYITRPFEYLDYMMIENKKIVNKYDDTTLLFCTFAVQNDFSMYRKVIQQDSLITQDNTPPMPLCDAHLGGLLFL